MKQTLVLLLLLSACASANNAKYREEKNIPKYSTSRSYVEPPEDVLAAATAVLEDLNRESDPATTESVKNGPDMVATGWVYSTSKDKYVDYKFNGTSKRKPLKVRRKYSYSITPSLSGSQVLMTVTEEIKKVDLKTGVDKDWDQVDADRATFEMLTTRLNDKLRTL